MLICAILSNKYYYYYYYPRTRCTVKCPRYARGGGGMLKFRIDRRLMWTRLILTGAPGPPIIYQPKDTVLDDTSFTLKWQRPEDTGGDDNIEYIVRYRDETEADEPGPWNAFTTKELEYDVKDLDKGKKYKFEVIAKNEGGESSPAERLFEISVLAGKICGLVCTSSCTYLFNQSRSTPGGSDELGPGHKRRYWRMKNRGVWPS